MCIEGPVSLIPGPHSIKSLISEYLHYEKPEEAFLACNLGEILRKHEEWLAAMPRVKPFYAVKCNDNSYVLRILAGLGTGFDCASKVEMEKIIALGVDPSRIIFANPNKHASHIRAAQKMSISVMTFDNVDELYKIKASYPSARLLLRIRCDSKVAIRQLGMKFGAFPEEAPALLNAAYDLGLNVVGISFHVGSGCMEPAAFQRAIESSKWLFSVGFNFGYKMNKLDIGGGFAGGTGSDITEIANVVNASLQKHFPVGCGVDIIAEPGRFYVAAAFKLLTQIHSRRERQRDKSGETNFMYFINDGLYGCLKYYHHVGLDPKPIRASAYDVEDIELIPCSVWGPTCDGLDQVCERIMLPKMEIDDWLMFDDMGAYTIAVAGTFNGFPVPRVAYLATYEAWKVLGQILQDVATDLHE